VRVTTDKASPKFVAPEARIAAFNQDGTTWVEQPMYTQVMFALHQVGVMAQKDPKMKDVEPFKTVLSGDRAAMAKLTVPDLEKILAITHTGMTVEAFQTIVQDWIAKAKHQRFERPYTELVYQPMLEVMQYLRASGYKTYFVTGGGQDFVPTYAEKVYGVPPEQVVGLAADTKFGYDKNGKATLTKVPKVLLIDDKVSKPVGIHLMIGRRAVAAFGNSAGDQQMLEYTQAGDGARLMMLVHHDDGQARVRLRAEVEGWHLPRRADGRGQEARLGRHQHAERLEAHLRVRMTNAKGADGQCRLGSRRSRPPGS